MMDLDPEKMKWFWKDICPTAAEATKVRRMFSVLYQVFFVYEGKLNI